MFLWTHIVSFDNFFWGMFPIAFDFTNFFLFLKFCYFYLYFTE